ncbi:hypothetical protein OEA41_001819 [Lepraria neglecta]|uniref:Cytochrome P450 n=1 Tax=Lepraria neglecta TaxID=209136 RepID=A0AAE0DPD1_9LECA|nr:hypothetical protein OEA41_001819 [Lepraria neglecta]
MLEFVAGADLFSRRLSHDLSKKFFTNIYGQGKNPQKSSGYAPNPYFPAVFNTHNCIDKEMHGRKRRIVSQGFSPAAINASEPMILNHVNNLCEALLKTTKSGPLGGDGWSHPQDMASWTNYLTLDVISDLTYGQAFNLITKPNLRWLVNAIRSSTSKPSAWYNPDKWIFPEMADERKRFLEISTKYSEERMASQEKMSERNDIMSALLVARDPKIGIKLTEAEVWGEAYLKIAAGGDTTSTALASVLFYLSRSPIAYTRLSDEIRTIFPTIEAIHQGHLLNSCRYLRACLYEAMKLAPPAPGALWREVCSGGARIDTEQIPEGFDVGVCTFAICHNPERFLNKGTSPRITPGLRTPSDISAPTAFAPFLLGPRSCVTKPFTYLETSLALARLIYCLDFRAANAMGEGAPGSGVMGKERKEEFQIVDIFSSSKEGPVLEFKKR